jgi:hypothetical protein
LYSFLSGLIVILAIVLGSLRILPFLEWWYIYILLVFLGIISGVMGTKKMKNPISIIPLVLNITFLFFLIGGTIFMRVYGGQP